MTNFSNSELWRERIKARLNVFDGPLALIVFLILSVGLITLYSAGIDFPGRVQDQMRNIIFGVAIMWIAASVSPQMLMRFAVPLYTVGIALLSAAAALGSIKQGALRWIHVGSVIQPSELIKMPMLLMCASMFHTQ